VDSRYTAAHRGGSGPPLVCLHGFTDTWRTWELVLPALERRHDVLAPTLPGHAGGPPLPAEMAPGVVVDTLEGVMDDAGFGTAHIVGNSLGGYFALQLAARGRAESVVALAPAGGWARGDESFRDTLGYFVWLKEQSAAAAPHAEAIVGSVQGRRRVTENTAVRFEHIPPDLLAHQIRAVAWCEGAVPMVEHALQVGYHVDAEWIDRPVRIVWGTVDRLLPWPSAATRYRKDWLPHADWVELDDVGHCPQLDVPLETAQLILDFTSAGR